MLQRQLLRQSRLASSLRPSRSISTSPALSRVRHYQPLASRVAASIPSSFSRRWQSTEAEQSKEGEPAAEGESKASEPAAENPLQKELDVKSREVIDLKDKYLRSVADFRNLQERTKRDIDNARQYGIQKFAQDLLESIDNLGRALGAVPSESLKPDESNPVTKDLINLHSGLTMTETILISTLAKHGLVRFDPTEGEGRKFDSKLDEATFIAKAEGKEDNDILHVQSKGFMLNGRVLRPAKVGVVKNS